jgi:hypothetical protein
MVGGIKNKAQRLLGALSSHQSGPGSATPEPDQIPEKLASLVLANRASDDAKILEAEITRIQSGGTPDGHEGHRDVGEMRAYLKASYWTQFSLLSQRAFKNLYRSVRSFRHGTSADGQEPATDDLPLCHGCCCCACLWILVLRHHQ